ncbi:MAG TPA: hypothetical protein VM599_01095 [Thermoanaerobaculia bacterium]|nr:hypothetical protein [Thermoanaerobaculia bacterium]
MTGKIAACLALALALASLPSFAGTVYVPILSDNGVNGTDYVTRIWLTNRGNAPVTVETLFLANNTDGTKNREGGGKAVDKTTVRAGATVVLEVASGPGLLEIVAPGDGAGALAISAEIRNTKQDSAKVTHSIAPVLSSDNAGAAGDVLTLQGLRRTLDGVYTNLLLVNLGHAETQCTVKAFKTTGQQIAGTALLTLKPLTQVQFADALDILGEAQIRDVHARIQCDQPFFAYLTSYEREGGEVLVVGPSATGDSSLARPGDTTPSVPGAVLFTRNGTFHTPTPASPSGIFNIPVPADRTYSNVVVDFDFFHAGWFGADPGGLHSLVWLHRGACCWPQWVGNITVFANAHGPGKNQVKMISNMDQPRFANKSKGERGAALQPGQTYHAHFEYDTSKGVAFLEISQGGSQVAFITMPTTVNRLVPDPSQAWMIYFGHENATTHGPERPSYGWNFQNLRVEFLP